MLTSAGVHNKFTIFIGVHDVELGEAESVSKGRVGASRPRRRRVRPRSACRLQRDLGRDFFEQGPRLAACMAVTGWRDLAEDPRRPDAVRKPAT